MWPEWSGMVGRLYVGPGDAANGDGPRRGEASLITLLSLTYLVMDGVASMPAAWGVSPDI
jgi:hypothetical protein